MRRSAAILTVLLCTALVGCLAARASVRVGVYDLVTVGTLAAFAHGIRRNRAGRRDAWLLLLAGGATWGVGEIVGSVSILRGGVSPLGGVPAAFYLVGYALIGAGVLRLGWGVERRQALRLRIDAAVIVLGLVLALWTPLFDRVIDVNGGMSPTHVFAVLYPALDLLLLGWSLRIVLAGARGAAALLLPATFAFLLLGDLMHGTGAAAVAPAGDAAWLFSLFASAATALAPSMRDLQPPRWRPVRATAGRWALYGVALALLPTVFLVEWTVVGRITDRLMYVLAGLVLTGLVVTRLAMLFHDLEHALDDAEASERKFRMIFDASPIGISLGRDGIMTETNPALQRLLGYTAEELAGKHFTEVTHPGDTALEPHQVWGETERRQSGFDKRYVTRTGETVDTRVHVVVGLRDGLGIALIEDVRERRALEERLLQAQKLEAVGQLAGGIAHDFNNLMTAVRGYADMLLREVDDPQVMRKLATISESAERASELTRQLLAFARRQVLEVQELDLRRVVAEAEALLQPVLGDEVRLDTALGDGPVPVRVDPAQLERVLVNLAANAQEAMAHGGTLSVAVGAEGGEAVLTVADTGAGMTPDVREQIFEPFFTTKGLSESSGLGLATVHGIVHQSGGSIDVESAVGSGTRFTIRLPLASVAVAAAPGYD